MTAAPAPTRHWATINQAAKSLGVGRDTIRRMIARGELYAERITPRLIRVDLASHQPTVIGGSANE